MSSRRDHVQQDFYNKFDPRNRNPVTERVSGIENMIRRTLTELCMARFEWKGLPDSVNVRYLELTMFNKGLAVYFEHKDFGPLVLSGQPAARLNHYGDPLGFLAIGNGSMLTQMLKATECEPLWANALRRPDTDIVNIYAQRLADTDRTLEINTMNARQTGFAAIPENLLLSIDNVLQQMEEGARIIKVRSPEFGASIAEAITTIDLNIHPDMFDRLHVLRVRWYNECLGLLGIDNTNQDKKERLVEAEVDGNADQIAATRRVNLNQRQDWANRVNDHFKTNISVDYYKPPVKPVSADEMEADAEADERDAA